MPPAHRSLPPDPQPGAPLSPAPALPVAAPCLPRTQLRRRCPPPTRVSLPGRPQPGRIPSTKARAGPRVGVGWTPRPRPRPQGLGRARSSRGSPHLPRGRGTVHLPSCSGWGGAASTGPRQPRSARRGRRRPRGDVTGPRATHTLRPAWLPPPALPSRPPSAARPLVRPPHTAPPPAGGGAASAARCQANRGRGAAARPPGTRRRAPPPRYTRRFVAYWAGAADRRTGNPMGTDRGGSEARRAPQSCTSCPHQHPEDCAARKHWR